MTELCLEGCVCCSFWRGSGQWSMADPGLFVAVGTQEVQPGRKVGQCGEFRRQRFRGLLAGRSEDLLFRRKGPARSGGFRQGPRLEGDQRK